MEAERKSQAEADTLSGDKRALGRKWLARIEEARTQEKTWIGNAQKAVQAYTNEAEPEAYADKLQSHGGYDFNILFANVETIVPAVINSTPVPDIRRRFQDADPAARVVSEILERAIRVQIDDSRLQGELEEMAQDAFLAGRGVIRLRFFSDIVPSLPDQEELAELVEEKDPDYSERLEEDEAEGDEPYEGMGHNGGQPMEHLENERIRFEAVSWVDYRHGPAKRWEERPWEAFRFCVPYEDEAKSFNVPLIAEQTSEVDSADRQDKFKDGITGWEIWCKESRKVTFIDDHGVVLKEIDDPLGLSGFFCTPAPVQPITINGRLMPVCPFSIYRILADNLDDAVRRKNKLVSAMKAKGWYGIAEPDMQSVIDLNDNEFTPIAQPEVWAANGGIEKAIAFWPLEKFVIAIQQLDAAIDRYKQWIYEITGISDIVRGASMASETATAQNIKSQWGSLRIQKMQRLIERCARDLFVMMAEIIPTRFSLKTLEEMTGIPILPLPSDPPEVVQQKAAVMDLLKKKLASYYRIDVESGSTARADLTQQKQEVAQFLQGAGAYFQSVGPLVQQGVLPAEVALEIFIANARMFNLGRSVEDALENMVSQAKEKAAQAQSQPDGGKQPSPEEQAAAAKSQAEVQSMQADMQAKAQKTQMEGAQFQFDMQRQQQELQARMQEAAAKVEAMGQKAQVDAIIGQLSVELKKIELQIKQAELAAKVAPPLPIATETTVIDHA